MERDDAKKLIIREWDDWASTHLQPNEEGSGFNGLSFFLDLQRDRPDLLDFPAQGDKWQTVHGWLLQEGKVTD